MNDHVKRFNLHDALQNAFGSIEESARSLKKQSLIFPVSKNWMIEDLMYLRTKIDRIITELKTLE